MIKILIGTRNPHKVKEIKYALKRSPIRFITLNQLKRTPRIKETGRTYRANAIKKASGLARVTNQLVLAEDSGIEVDALKNRPGIYSSRYSGPRATTPKNNRKLLKELQGVPLSKRTARSAAAPEGEPRHRREAETRRARYRCVAVLTSPHKVIFTTEETCSGRIALAPRGKRGFGYDPLFIPRGYRKTFGQLPLRIKNQLSHRGKAFRRFKEKLRKYLTGERNFII